MSTRRRRALATISWRTMVVLVIGEAFWEAAGMVALGDVGYRSSSYDIMREVPGGMRLYGALLSALVLATAAAYGRHTASRRDRLLRVCLAALAAWYTGWLILILYTWVVQQQIAALGGVGKTLFVAAACLVTARSAPHLPDGG